MPRSIASIALFGLAAGAYALFVRPRMLRSGATKDEVAEPFPGSGIIPGAERGSTMAITIDAPPSEVWPWLVQMGRDRAGWYSWDRLDNGGRPSATRVHEEWQSLSVGQRLRSDAKGKHWFEVAAVEPERFLALRVSSTMTGRQFDSAAPRPSSFTDGLWSFQLKELPGARTRLIVTVHMVARPRILAVLSGFLFWEPAHWIMQTRQFANLKRRAEEAFGQHQRAVAQPPAPAPAVPAT